MAGLVWVRFTKDGRTKQVSSKIANNKDYQRSHGFELVDAPPSEPQIQPQKKIEVKSPVAVSDELEAKVETASFEETKEPIKELTKEEAVVKLHKEGKTEDEIKQETGLNKLTIRALIKKI